MGTGIFELPSFPHAFFNLVDCFLINEEEVGCLTEMCDLGSEREVMDVFQCIVELRSLVSTIFEVPEVIVCIPWSFSLIMVRDCIQGPTVLTPISGDNAYNMWVRAHDDPGVTCRDASSLAVGDYAGDEIGPAIEVES